MEFPCPRRGWRGCRRAQQGIYLALGNLPGGTRDILGLWIESAEGAKFCMKGFNDLKTRGMADILIPVTDGPKGIGEALGAMFPATKPQTCIVHLIRNSLDDASWIDSKLLAAAQRPVCTAVSACRRRTVTSAALGGSATPPSGPPGAGPGTG